jgi:hypothetical protein
MCPINNTQQRVRHRIMMMLRQGRAATKRRKKCGACNSSSGYVVQYLSIPKRIRHAANNQATIGKISLLDYVLKSRKKSLLNWFSNFFLYSQSNSMLYWKTFENQFSSDFFLLFSTLVTYNIQNKIW